MEPDSRVETVHLHAHLNAKVVYLLGFNYAALPRVSNVE